METPKHVVPHDRINLPGDPGELLGPSQPPVSAPLLQAIPWAQVSCVAVIQNKSFEV